MTEAGLADYLDSLERAAIAANLREEDYRKEAMQRIKALEQERSFAFRRLNLVRTISESLAPAENEADAVARGSSALLRELNWSGGTEAQREVVKRFVPVVAAIWNLKQTAAPSSEAKAGSEPLSADKELCAFEEWYASRRNDVFFCLMDAEPIDLPLVEV